MHDSKFRALSLGLILSLVALFFLCANPKLAATIQSGFLVLARTGNTNTYATSTGVLTSGDCVKIDASGNLIDNGTTCAGAGPGGSVTSVSFTGGLISVANPTTTPALTVAGTSGGIPYFSSGTTWASSTAGTAGHLMLWGGAGSAPTDGGAPLSAQLHSIGFVIDGGGSVISTGAVKVFPTADFSCTINRVDVSADQSGSITIDVWKVNAAIPVAANKISASAPITLSAAQLAQSGSLTGWTTSVSTNDVFGFNVATVATVTRVTGQIWCN